MRVWHGAAQLHDQRPLAELIVAEEERRQHTQMLYGRIQSMAVNVHYWKTHAVEKHECRTCRRRFASHAEQEGFLALQAGPMNWPQTCPACLHAKWRLWRPLCISVLSSEHQAHCWSTDKFGMVPTYVKPCAVAWMVRPWSTPPLCSAWSV